MLRRAYRKIRYAVLLTRAGGLRVLVKQLWRQVYSTATYIGLEKGLDTKSGPVLCALEYSLQLASKDDMKEVLEEAKTESSESAHELVQRHWFYESGLHGCYIARTVASGALCHMQWLVSAKDELVIHRGFKNRLPRIKADEVLVENVFTFEKYRGSGLMSSVLVELAERAKNEGFKRMITYVRHDNTASLIGCQKAGFNKFEEIRERKLLFFTKRNHNQSEGNLSIVDRENQADIHLTREAVITESTTGQQRPLNHSTNQVGAVVIGGDFQGLGILRSLGRHNIPTYLLDRGFCIGRFSRYVKRYKKVPSVKDETSFLNFLTDLARKEKLAGWVIYPNDDEMVRFLAREKEPLEEYYRVSAPPWEVVRFAYDKRLTYQLAEKVGIAIPKTFYPSSIEELAELDIRFPVIIKPSVKEPFYSRTRKKAIRADDREQLSREFFRVSSVVENTELMVQELIAGGPSCLYSVGSFYKNGEFLGKVVARRVRQHPMDFGHATTYAETVDIPELEESAGKILNAMGYYGLSEVEFMWDPRDEKYKLIEINARPWGWHTLAFGAGVDLPYLLYLDMLGEKVKQNGFNKEAKWVRLITDIPTATGEILKGRMKATEYLTSLKGRKQYAVFSLTDPLPFVAEIFVLPYLWKKRGF